MNKYVMHGRNRDWKARCLKMFSIFLIAANLIAKNKEGDFYNIEAASRMGREFSFTENALNDALTFIFPFCRVAAAHSATLKKEITNFLLLAACLLTASMAIYQHCSSFGRISGTVIRFFFYPLKIPLLSSMEILSFTQKWLRLFIKKKILLKYQSSY